MKLSVAFDSLKYELLLPRVKACGSDNNLDKTFMRSYLAGRLQRCIRNKSFSEW